MCWTNTNPDGSVHGETLHAALPPQGEDTEKWVIQLWFRPYRMHRIRETSCRPCRFRPANLSSGEEPLPDGAWIPSAAAGNQ